MEYDCFWVDEVEVLWVVVVWCFLWFDFFSIEVLFNVI